MTGKSKTKKLTIRDIALEAGVSVTTASFVLNGQEAQYGIKPETAERVRKVIRDRHFRPNYGARLLKSGRSHTLAFIAPTIAEGFYNDIVVAIETAALQAGYQLVLCNSLDDVLIEEVHLKNLIERQIDGIVLAPVIPNAPHLELLKQAGIRTVLLCPPETASPGFCCADFDLSAAPRLAIEHLLQKDCERFVLLDWLPAHGRPSSWTRNRTVLRQMFLKTLRKNKIPGGKEHIWTLFGEEPNPADAANFQRMLKETQPDALIAMRDIQLLRAWRPLTEAGFSVPEDIRLVGCDDIDLLHYWSPAITTVRMPKKELGEHAVKVLLDRSVEGETRIFPISLEGRASSL
jgi:LacI family transcriptional regulator